MLPHVREEAPPPSGHNRFSPAQVDAARQGIRRIRSLQRQIDQLNKDKQGVYAALRDLDIEPALIRKVAYRLTLSKAEVQAVQERDEQLVALWLATRDLQDEFAAEDEAEAEDDAFGQPGQSSSSPSGSSPSSNGQNDGHPPSSSSAARAADPVKAR